MAHKKLRRFTISGFRGIRHSLSIDFTNKYESVLIYGANAKGKSSIGDAFEWFFTGDVKELMKEGCSRTDYRHRLLGGDDDAIIGLELSEANLNSELRLKSTKRQNHTNSTEEFAKYLQVSKEELLILRHKDLKAFVDETKGEKRKQISHLIGMEGWEKIRTDMATVENRLSTLLEHNKQAIRNRQQEVADLIDTETYSLESCWKFAESQSKVLGLQVSISSIDDLRALDEKAKTATRGSDRSLKLAELRTSELILQQFENDPPSLKELEDFESKYNEFSANPQKVLCVQLNDLFNQGKSLLESEEWTENLCPLCENHIPKNDLLSHIQEHQEKNQEILEEFNQFEITRNKAKQELGKISSLVQKQNNLKLEDIDGVDTLKKLGTEVAIAIGIVKAMVEQPLKTGSILSLKETELSEKLSDFLAQSKTIKSAIGSLQKTLAPTKEETERIEAFQTLSNLTSHMAKISSMGTEISPLEKQVSSISAFNTAFKQLRRETMGTVLEAISEDVSRYFLTLHSNEGFDDVQLKFLPEEDGVEFHIYYKGEEITPPRTFLSESYLNGLGVCLFLATVRAFNKENGFVILDDIVNSFDAEHRADLASLLVNEFSNHQLIVLTHDSIWFDVFRRLAKSGWQHRRITRWSYENGIEIETSQTDALADCRDALGSGRIEIAAPRVRTYIENRLKTLLIKLGGRVRFREGTANDERASGELLFELKKHLNEGGFFEFAEVTSFDELEASTFITNYGSHDRPPAPAGLSIGDINFALERIINLEKVFVCPSCNKKIWNIVGRNYKMQCECGQYSL